MTNSVLYVFNETCNAKKLVRYCIKKNIRKIFLCSITTNQDTISLVVKNLSTIKNCIVEILPYLEYFNKIAFSERNNFIQFVTKLGEEPRFNGINPREYFKYPNSSFSAWWLSTIVEKNTLKNKSYHNLVKLLAILKLKEEYNAKKIISDIDSPELSRALKNNAENNRYEYKNFKKHKTEMKFLSFSLTFLKSLKHYLCLIYKIIIVTVNTRGLNFRKKILENAKYIAITYFPLIDKGSLNQKKFINKYYNSLQVLLEHKYRGKFIWLAITADIDGFNFKTGVKLGRQINLWNYPLYFMEEWLSIKDLFLILAEYVYFLVKFFVKPGSLPRKLEYAKRGINIWGFFEKGWFSSFAGHILMDGIIYYRIFRNISASLKNGMFVIYLAENKSWEKASNFAFHQRRGLTTVGILHTTVPLLALQFFNSKNDLEKSKERKFAMPAPDYIACNGRISLELMQKSGWDKKRALLWFAVRYQNLRKQLEGNISWSSRKNKILVPLSTPPVEIEETLSYIYQAFKGKLGYQVVIREHYLFPIRPFIKRLNIDFDNDIFIISNEDLNKSLSTAKAAVVTGSSAALESIALGCPVIIPKLANIVDMSPLSGVSDLPIYVWSPEELRSTVDDIMGRKESPLSGDKCKDFIESYFNFFNSENELLEKLECINEIYARYIKNEKKCEKVK